MMSKTQPMALIWNDQHVADLSDAAWSAFPRKASTPHVAARLGRSRTLTLRGDWESVKVDVMRRAVRAKFEQHPDLAALLIGTGDARIVEHTRNDAFWGDAGDGSGANMLGCVLMEIRAQLRR
jgi:N-glycosidase YbiA